MQRGERMNHKMSVCILLMMGVVCTISSAYTNKELFLRGNHAYEDGEYAVALKNYEDIESKGSAVWENMGNCYFHMNQYAQAKVCWQRAQRNCGSAHEYAHIAHNIDVLEHADILEPSPKDITEYVYSYCASWSLLALQLLILISWFLVVYLLLYKRNRIMIASSVGFIMFIMMIIFGIVYQQKMGDYAVVCDDGAPVYIGPDTSYHVEGKLGHTATVRVTDTRSDWYKIMYKDLAGWVQADKLVRI